MIYQIEFEVICETKLGENAVICGNLPDLGSWQPQKALQLQTDKPSFPVWTSSKPIFLKQGVTLQFKLCLLSDSGTLMRWELVGANRIITPRSSLIISFSESEGSTLCKVMEKRQSTTSLSNALNVRRGTEDVINDLASDSSSNREMWKEHRFTEEDESLLLLNQFTQNLGKAVATQREQLLPLQLEAEMQLQKVIKFGHLQAHPLTTHYFITDATFTALNLDERESSREKMVVLSCNNIEGLEIKQKGQVSVFHLLGKKVFSFFQSQKQREIFSGKFKGLLVLYLQEQHPSSPYSYSNQGIDIIVCANVSTASVIADESVSKGYRICSSARDEFLIFDGDLFLSKIIIHPFNMVTFLEETNLNLGKLKPSLTKDFYFKYSDQQVRKELRTALNSIQLPRYSCLLVMHVNKLDELSVKIIGDLIQLSSLKYDLIKFPKNMKDKVALFKNRMLVLNTYGEIYSNAKEASDLYNYLEISKAKFDQNLKLIFQEIGTGVNLNQSSNSLKMIAEFPKGPFGNLLRERAFKCIKDINKKSLAKIMADVKGDTLQLIPFVLHPTFLLKVALATFTSRLRPNEKGLVLSIDSEGLSETKWLYPPQGREVNLELCRFCLTEEERRYYGSAPLQEESLQKLLDVVGELEEQKKKLE